MSILQRVRGVVKTARAKRNGVRWKAEADIRLDERSKIEKEIEELQTSLDSSNRQTAELIVALASEQRRREAYFAIIETIEQERNDWRDRFHEQARSHQQAQRMLERTIERVTALLQRVVSVVNVYRQKAGEAPIDSAEKLQGLVTNTSDDYAREMQRLSETGPPGVDGKKLRADVDTGEDNQVG